MAGTLLSHALRRLGLLALAVGVAACGGGGPAAKALGQEAVVEHANVSPGTGPTTTLAVTALAVRTGTIAELEAGGFKVDAADRGRTPTFLVDLAHKAARVSFLPHVPGKDTDWVYWNVP